MVTLLKKQINFRFLPKLAVCRKIRLDLWGDVLFSNRGIRLFRKFKKKRIIRRRKPGRLSKSYKSRRLLYILRHHRAFINWFRTSKHLSSDVRIHRKLTLTAFKRRIYFNSRVNFKSLFNPAIGAKGAEVNSERMEFYNNVSNNLRDNSYLSMFGADSFDQQFSIVDQEHNVIRRGVQAFVPRPDRMAFRLSRTEELRERVTRRWPQFKKLRWRYFKGASLLGSIRTSLNRNYTIFSPRLNTLSKVYMNFFDELKSLSYLDTYSDSYSKFIKLRSPSWFMDSSKKFFMEFKRRFFIGYLYFSKPSATYFSSIYDYLNQYTSSSVYNKGSLHSFFLKRRISSTRPSRRPELLFNSILKRSKYGPYSNRRMALFEVRRKDFLLNLIYRKLIRRKPISVFSDDNSNQLLDSLKRARSEGNTARPFLKDRRKFRYYRPVTSKSLYSSSTRRTRAKLVKARNRIAAGRGKTFGFKKFRGLPRLYRGSVFTKKDYMDILLNRDKQFRKKRKSAHRHDMLAKRKIKFFYGFISENAFRSLFKHYTQYSNEFFFRFLRSLESRIYMVLYRSGLFNSVKLAKQLVLHSHILVNNSKISDFNYLIKKGDIITFDPSFSLLGFNKLKLNWVNRKVIPPSNFIISYKLPAIIMAEDYEGLQDFKFNFSISGRKLNRFYKA